MIRFYDASKRIPPQDEMNTMAFNQLSWPEITIRKDARNDDLTCDAEEEIDSDEQIAMAIASVSNWEHEIATGTAAALVGMSGYELLRYKNIAGNEEFLGNLGLGNGSSLSGGAAIGQAAHGSLNNTTAKRKNQDSGFDGPVRRSTRTQRKKNEIILVKIAFSACFLFLKQYIRNKPDLFFRLNPP